MKVLMSIVEGYGPVRSRPLVERIRKTLQGSGFEIAFLGILDGASPDRLSHGHREDAPDGLVELAFSQTLEYGERVKMAMDYALAQGMDVAVILEGDARYPADGIERLVNAIGRDQADMALAIPQKNASAREKRAFRLQPGARFAARILNALSRAHLNGWHCGFRAYRVRALARIPFQHNANSRMFNTEIIIQFLLSDLAIAETPVPGYIHRSLGLFAKTAFALQMVKASALSVLHRMNLFYQRHYDVTPPIEVYDLKLGYASSHTAALSKIPDGSNVLDIGCGNGALDALLRERGCKVRGMDRHAVTTSCALEEYIQIDLDVRSHNFEVSGYDRILILDVLEHLRFPELLLDHIRARCGLGEKPLVVISVPNVAFFIIRLRLLFGGFQYGKLGILDLTHCRLFTVRSIKELLLSSGYSIESVEGVPAPYPKAIGLNPLSRFLVWANKALIRLSLGLFSYQILLTAKPRPRLEDGQKTIKTSPRVHKNANPA